VSVLHPQTRETASAKRSITTFGPDFPFAFDDWLRHPAGLGHLPPARLGTEVAIIGGGLAGVTAAYELMKLGCKPVIYEAGRLGGRLRSEAFEGDSGLIAELGGMRFPSSSVCFYHYLDLLGLRTRPFPNPLDPATPSTLLDLEGDQVYVEGDHRLARCVGGTRRFQRHAGRHTRARRSWHQGDLEPARAALGRADVL
jgi:tryptophan 2-monooxygenase